MIHRNHFAYLPWMWTGLVAILLMLLFGDHGYDDPYITYRYAENLAHGVGFVYNQGERVLSTTTPLYAMALAVAGWLGADIPSFSNMLGSLSLALGGIAFWELGRAWRSWAIGLIGLLIYPLFSLLALTIGSETPLYLTLILFAFLAYARERYLVMAALLALATLVRADGALAAVAVVCAFLAGRRGPIPWRAVGLYLLLLAPWLIFALLYFGAPFPATLAAKRRQGLLPSSELFFTGLVRHARDEYWAYLPRRPQSILALIGVCYVGIAERPWLLVVGWSLLYTAAYTALGVTSYFWYYGPVVVGLIVLIGAGLTAIFECSVRVLKRRWAGWAALAIGLIAVLIPVCLTLWRSTTSPDARLAIYRATGEWLRDHTPADARVGALEVGIIGYHAQRPMIDFAGLLQPDVALQLSPTTSYDDAAVWAFQRFRPEYLVLQSNALPHLEHDIAPANGCRVIQTFHNSRYQYLLLVLECPRI
jgi:hypothetical protein